MLKVLAVICDGSEARDFPNTFACVPRQNDKRQFVGALTDRLGRSNVVAVGR